MEDSSYQPDYYTQWLGLPSEPRPPDYYTLLDLPPGCGDVAKIEAAGHRQGDQLDRYRTAPSRERRDACARLMNEVARAVTVLRDPVRREAYNRSIGLDTEAPDAQPADDDVPMARPGEKLLVTTRVTPAEPDHDSSSAGAGQDDDERSGHGSGQDSAAAAAAPGLPGSNVDAAPLAPALAAESRAEAIAGGSADQSARRRPASAWRRWTWGVTLLLALSLCGVGVGAWMAGFNPLAALAPLIGGGDDEAKAKPQSPDGANRLHLPPPVRFHDRFASEEALVNYRVLPDRTRLVVRDEALVVGVQTQGEVEIRRLIGRQPVRVGEASLGLRLAPDVSLDLMLGPGAGLRLHRAGHRVTGHALPRTAGQPPMAWSADEPLRISLAPSPDGGTMIWTVNGQTLRTFPASLMAARLDPLRMILRGPIGDCLWIEEVSLVGQPIPRRERLR